ncbi:MAG: hypothetical protein AB1650_00480 [Candidatus Omnitrophota bacterium]
MQIIPYLLSLCAGTLIVKKFLKDTALPFSLFLGLSLLSGISISIFICFFSFVFFNTFNLLFTLMSHGLIIGLLVPKTLKTSGLPEKTYFLSELVPALLILLITGTISFIFAKNHPDGGWDAWQVWNFKAKFLLLSGSRWKELFAPELWRSSPHYPLAIPLWNVWTWSFSKDTPWFIPFWNSILSCSLTSLFIFGFLQRKRMQALLSWIPALFLFTIPFFMTLAVSQYADIFLGLYLLAALGSLYLAFTSLNVFLIFSGIFTGILSFIKPEGTILAGLTFTVAMTFIFKNKDWKEKAFLFLPAALIAGLPSILFQLFLSPGNQTFINGLASSSNPSTLLRLKIILGFFIIEITRLKWGFLWFLLLAAALLNFKKVFKEYVFVLPVIAYMLIVIFYYWVNTYFEIEWWLAVSLNRILMALAPALILWISLSVIPKKSSSL